jgi:hypothetical protein
VSWNCLKVLGTGRDDRMHALVPTVELGDVDVVLGGPARDVVFVGLHCCIIGGFSAEVIARPGR